MNKGHEFRLVHYLLKPRKFCFIDILTDVIYRAFYISECQTNKAKTYNK